MDVRVPGSSNDASVFKESMFGQFSLQEKLKIPREKCLLGTSICFPHFLIADEAFPLPKDIMRPYPGKYLGEQKNIYN